MNKGINLSGKDWLDAYEAAFYCCVSEDHFRRHAAEYGLIPRNFMGKQVYERAALYAAIHGAKAWCASPSLSVVTPGISTGEQEVIAPGHPSARLANERLRKYELRRKRS